MDLRTEYDRWHEHGAMARPGEADERQPWYLLVEEYLDRVRDKRVLEVACGRGGFSRRLTTEGAQVFGVDFSGSALRIIREKIGVAHVNGYGPRLVQADAHALPFPNSFFDIVVSCETIEHLMNPSVALQGMARVCKPGGMLYLTTPNYVNPMGLYLIYDWVRKRERVSPEVQPIDHRWTFSKIRHLVARAGWEIQGSDGTVHQFPVRGRNPVRLPSLEKNRWIRRCLSPFAFHYLIIARKAENRAC